MNHPVLPRLPSLAWVFLALGLFMLAAAQYRAHTSIHNPNLSAREDEVVFHGAEVQRIAQGGAIVSDDSKAAMIPGYHALLAALPEGLRVTAHLLCNTLALLMLLMLARTLLPGQPVASTAAWLTMLIGPYAVSQAAWMNTDGLGRGLFALTLVAALRLPQNRRGHALLALIAAACVLSRNIYFPALLGLFALAAVWKDLDVSRERALWGLSAVVLAVSPFLWEWQSLNPPGLDANNSAAFTRAVIVAELFWAGLLAPLLWFARKDWSIKPLLPWFGLGAAAVVWTLWAGTWVLVAEDTPTALRSGAMLYMLDRANLPATPLLVVKLLGIGLGATMVGYLLWQAASRKPKAAFAALGLLAYVVSLWLQPRPYNRYFEIFLLLAMMVPLRTEFSDKAWRYVPLVGFFAAYAAAFHLFVR